MTLPTRGENFGHVIFEALAAGVPALISDRTPWRNLEEKKAGWAKPLEEIGSFVQVITEFAKRNLADKNELKLKARMYALDHANQDVVVQVNRALFRLTMQERQKVILGKEPFTA